MLGLGDEIGRDTIGIRGRRGEDHALGRARGQVDADLAADLDLRGGHPCVARANDSVHGCEAGVRQAVGQSPDRLRATGDHEHIDLEQAGSPEEDRVVGSGPVGRGGDDDPLDARDLRGDDGHHQ